MRSLCQLCLLTSPVLFVFITTLVSPEVHRYAYTVYTLLVAARNHNCCLVDILISCMHRTRAHLTKLPQMLHISKRIAVTHAAGAEEVKTTTRVAEAMTISYVQLNFELVAHPYATFSLIFWVACVEIVFAENFSFRVTKRVWLFAFAHKCRQQKLVVTKVKMLQRSLYDLVDP